ncbi:TTLL12 family protein [Megaselia abdita]
MDDPDRVDKILKSLWKYCQAYSLYSDTLSAEERVPVWYMMDEVGSAVNHSDDPNFKLVPFMYLPTQMTFSLLFPIEDVEEGERVTADFVSNIPKDSSERAAYLLPWKYTDFSDKSFVQTEPAAEYFSSGHIPEILPEISPNEPKIQNNYPLKVYSEYDVICEHLTDPRFQIVNKQEDADVWWLTTHFKDFAKLAADHPNTFINQFPYEFVITIKDLLGIVCRRRSTECHHDANTLETFPEWLPTTYNLKTEIVEFVSYFQNRQNMRLDNYWIIKPWNLARSLDTYITNNVHQIVRLPSTGPKIAQKYIENPVLFFRNELNAKVKFDIRYVILVKRVQPLEAYIHRKFYLRFSNKAFSLDSFDDYEKHFTVMNYTESAELKHLKCEDFVKQWLDQYPQINWYEIENEICSMFKEMLLCAAEKNPPSGISPFSQSRALYAADLMLAWKGKNKVQPKLLEVNYTPDCQRACQYYPDFFNEIFKLLFLNEKNENAFRLI